MRLRCEPWALLLAALLLGCGQTDPAVVVGVPTCPDAGEPDAGVPDAGVPDGGTAGTCQDDNPCTLDLVDDAGRCSHPPTLEGMACGDGNACTTDDRCVSGVCQGTPITHPAETYGTVWSLGADPIEYSAPPLEGMAEFMTDDRLLFGERRGGRGLSLSLVQVGPDGVRRLDHRAMDVYVERYFGSWDWSDRFLTFLVPLGPERVVVVGTRQRLELLGLEEDRITSLSRYPLHSASDSILAGAGRGDRFWTCAGYAVTAWRVGADDSLAPEPGQEFLLPGSCRSLALSEDGATLWAATSSGLVPVDVSSPTGPVVKPALLASKAFYHLRLDGTWLVAHELRRYGELGSLLVFRVADLVGTADPVPVKSFAPIDGGGLWARPVGFALLKDTLLVEWFRVSGGTARAYRVERHTLDATGVSAALGGLTLRESEELGLLLSPLPVAGRGRRAVLQPWRRVVELEGPEALRFQTGAYHGSLERVWVDDQGDVLAVGPFGTHRVDLSEPRQPALTAGALDLPPDTRRLRLAPARSASGPLELLTLAANRANVQQEAGTAVLSCLRPGAGGLMEPAGILRIDGGPAALASTRGQLFQVAATPAGPLRLRRFSLPTTCTGDVLGPTSERLFTLGAASTRKGLGFAVDAQHAEVLLGELHFEGTTFRAQLAWGAWEGTEPVATGTLPATTDQFTALALAGGRGLVIENRRQLHVLRRDGDRIVTESSLDLMQQPQPVEVSSLLAFDGQVAWLALASPTFGALALRVDTPGQVVASYETPAPVRSIDFAGERLVLGMNEALTVAAPACESPPGTGH